MSRNRERKTKKDKDGEKERDKFNWESDTINIIVSGSWVSWEPDPGPRFFLKLNPDPVIMNKENGSGSAALVVTCLSTEFIYLDCT